MPRERGEAISESRQNLTSFGKWFYIGCDYLGVPATEVAARAKLHVSSISKATRTGTERQGPTRDTVVRIAAAFREVAAEKHLAWSTRSEDVLFHSAGFATNDEMQAAELSLRTMEIIAEQRTQPVARARRTKKERQ